MHQVIIPPSKQDSRLTPLLRLAIVSCTQPHRRVLQKRKSSRKDWGCKGMRMLYRAVEMDITVLAVDVEMSHGLGVGLTTDVTDKTKTSGKPQTEESLSDVTVVNGDVQLYGGTPRLPLHADAHADADADARSSVRQNSAFKRINSLSLDYAPFSHYAAAERPPQNVEKTAYQTAYAQQNAHLHYQQQHLQHLHPHYQHTSQQITHQGYYQPVERRVDNAHHGYQHSGHYQYHGQSGYLPSYHSRSNSHQYHTPFPPLSHQTQPVASHRYQPASAPNMYQYPPTEQPIHQSKYQAHPERPGMMHQGVGWDTERA